jgi:hypothetical protein
MRYKESFISTYQDGTLAKQEDWLKTLPLEEQLEFADADKRQKQLRQDAIDEGRLVYSDTSREYIWKDKDTFHINKPADPGWMIYWDRWLKEENIIFIRTYTEVE